MKDVIIIKSIDARRYESMCESVMSTFTLEKKPDLYFYSEVDRPVILFVVKANNYSITTIYPTGFEDIVSVKDELIKKVIDLFEKGGNNFFCDLRKNLVLYDAENKKILEGKFSWVPAFVPKLNTWVFASYSLAEEGKYGVCAVKQDSDNLIFLAALQRKSESFLLPKDRSKSYDGANLYFHLQAKLWGFPTSKPTSAGISKFCIPLGEMPLIPDKLFSNRIAKVEDDTEEDEETVCGMITPKTFNNPLRSWVAMSQILKYPHLYKPMGTDYIVVFEDFKINIGVEFKEIHYKNETFSFFVDGVLPNLDEKEEQLKVALAYDKVLLFDRSENILHNSYMSM